MMSRSSKSLESNTRMSPVREYKKFANLKNNEVEPYILNRLPLPAPTERFNWQECQAREAALLEEVKGWPRYVTKRRIGYRVLSLIISLTLFLIAYSIGIWWITIPVIVLGIIFQYKFSNFGWRNRLHYRINKEYLEHNDFFIDRLHLKSLHKWAISRYDFSSDKEDFAAWRKELGKEFYLENDGPLSGCIVSAATRQELALKPNGFSAI